MSRLALLTLLVVVPWLAGCDGGKSAASPHGKADDPASHPVEGRWVSASGTQEVVIHRVGRDQFELVSTVVTDRRNRAFDQVRTFVVHLEGNQLLAGGLPLASVDSQGRLVFGGRPLVRQPQRSNQGSTQ